MSTTTTHQTHPLDGAGVVVRSRNAEIAGVTNGGAAPCPDHDGNCQQFYVRWPDGTHSIPCTSRVVRGDDGVWAIA